MRTDNDNNTTDFTFPVVPRGGKKLSLFKLAILAAVVVTVGLLSFGLNGNGFETTTVTTTKIDDTTTIATRKPPKASFGWGSSNGEQERSSSSVAATTTTTLVTLKENKKQLMNNNNLNSVGSTTANEDDADSIKTSSSCATISDRNGNNSSKKTTVRKKLIKYYQRFLDDTNKLLLQGDEEITKGIIQYPLQGSSPSSKNMPSIVTCAQEAFEANFQRSLQIKKGEIIEILDGLRNDNNNFNIRMKETVGNGVSGKDRILPSLISSNNNTTTRTTSSIISKDVAKVGDVEEWQQTTTIPEIPFEQLVYGLPCTTTAATSNNCMTSHTSSLPNDNRRQREEAIKQVIFASSSYSSSSGNNFNVNGSVSNGEGGVDVGGHIHVYMIHYTPMKQRRAVISKILSKHQISPEWVTGFDKEDIDSKTSACITEGGGENNNMKPRMKPSQVSVVVKHHSALYDIVRYKRPISLILEDDALLRYNIAERIGDLLVEVYQQQKQQQQNSATNSSSQPPHYFDVMWVGGCIKMHAYRRKYNTVPISTHLFSKNEARCAHAYLVTYLGAKRLLRNFPLSRPIDFQFTNSLAVASSSSSLSAASPSDEAGRRQPAVVSLWVEPWLSIQGDMGGCVTNDLGAKCITVVKKYDPAFDESKLLLPSLKCSSSGAETMSPLVSSSHSKTSSSPFIDLGWDRVPKHGSS